MSWRGIVWCDVTRCGVVCWIIVGEPLEPLHGLELRLWKPDCPHLESWLYSFTSCVTLIKLLSSPVPAYEAGDITIVSSWWQEWLNEAAYASMSQNSAWSTARHESIWLLLYYLVLLLLLLFSAENHHPANPPSQITSFRPREAPSQKQQAGSWIPGGPSQAHAGKTSGIDSLSPY